ncbi:6112_t:CDS:2 [Dentiscutata erythropus]|uniref:6112_t:CDS:1 n=1 Tax=Dentiscutata erythropus TaxID=1348616 RepID=A0A9N9DSL2_9GLOM|nr:6112_t:CDS:2 [Dentiscutata erythropus]
MQRSLNTSTLKILRRSLFVRFLSATPICHSVSALKKWPLKTRATSQKKITLGQGLVQKKTKSNFKNKPTPVSKNTRGFIPAKFRLMKIESDVKLPNKLNKSRELSADTKDTKRQTNIRTQETTLTEQPTELINLKKRFKSSKSEICLTDLTFESLKLREEVYNALRQGALKDVEPFLPTEIQALTIPEILKTDNEHILCAAETGSGKTLAYLLPIVNKLKDEEANSTAYTREDINAGMLKIPIDEEKQQYVDVFQKELEQELQLKTVVKSTARRFNRPRAIVLLPSRELVDQILSVAKLMSHYAKFRAIAITSNKERRFIKKTLEMPVDIVIATPAGLLEYVEQGYISMADTKYLVIDEADTMFGKGFGEEVQKIVTNMKNSGKNQKRPYQIIIVSATLPKTVNEMLNQEFPNIKSITSHSLHKVLPNLKHNFIDMKDYNYNKSAAILEVLKKHNTNELSTMIFCNTRVSAHALEAFLKTKKLPVIGLFGNINERNKKLEAFRNQEPNAKILVCTDLASRGIDTTFVNHVILYDFPTTVVNFLHRVGRTARAGRKGDATYFLS